MAILDRFKRKPTPAVNPPLLEAGQHMVTFESLGMH